MQRPGATVRQYGKDESVSSLNHRSELCCWSNNRGKISNDAYPPEEIGCTDVACLVVFVVFCLIMLLISIFALYYGNPYRLINGMDSFGNVCGTRNEVIGDFPFSGMDMTRKPYLLFMDIADIDVTWKICVEECPSAKLSVYQDLVQFFRNTNTSFCRYDHRFEPEEHQDYFLKHPNALSEADNTYPNCLSLPYYPSLPILNRCVPKPDRGITSQVLYNVYAYLNNLNIFQQVLGDLAETWVTVVGLTSVSFAFSCLLVLMIHYVTAVMTPVIMISTTVLTAGLSAYSWWTYASIKHGLDNLPTEQTLDESVRNETAFMAFSILATLFTILLAVVTIVMRKRVAIVTQLFEEAGKAVTAMPCLVVQPFVTYILLTTFFCCWVYVLLCLATAGTLNTSHVSLNPTVESMKRKTGSTILKFSDTIWLKYMWWIHILGLIWCSEFILACQQMVVASSVSAWYFSRDRSSMRCIVLEATTRLIKHHLGSAALGSLLITLVKLPRLLISFCDRILRRFQDCSPRVKPIIRGCACCLGFFESVLKYVHHNAYTVIAIQGVNFCPAARLAFNGLVLNALQVSVINSTGDFLLFLAKCLTAAFTGFIAVTIFQSDEKLYFYAIPVLLAILFSYFVAHCVVSVFEMVVDTLFLCFCEDHNMNDGTDGKPYYAPPSLFKFMTEDAVDAVNPVRRKAIARNRKPKEIELQAIPEEGLPIV